MSKRFWSGFWLTPWLLASSGCTTVPFGSSASRPPLPADRSLAIAQTFERQGHVAQARQIYEQMLAADPKSTTAADRLQTLIAKSESATRDRQAQAQITQSRRVNEAKTRQLPTPTLREVLADTAKPYIAQEQDVASTPAAISGSADLRSTELQRTSHLTTIKSTETLEPRSLSTDSIPDLQPSPTSIVVNGTSAKESKLDEAGIAWELPAKRSSIPEDLGLEDLDIERPDPLAIAAIDSKRSEDSTVDIEKTAQTASPKGEALIQKHQHLFGEFKSSMLNEVRENRAELQDALLSIAEDATVNLSRRTRAVFLLGQIGAEAIDAVPVLKQVMNSNVDPSFRMETAEAILMIQPDNDDAVWLLLEFLKDDDANVRWYAAFAMRLGSSAHPHYVNLAIDRLIGATADGDRRLRRMAMLSLGAFGRSANKAVPILIPALEDSDEMTRVIAAASLKLITEQPVSPPQFVSRITDGSNNAQ